MNPHGFVAITGHGLARASQTAGGEWAVETLLADQDVRCLAADPQQPQTIYAGTQGNGVLCSDDAGKTWQPAGLSGQIIKALAVSPSDPQTVYAGTKPAYLYVSRDGGGQWTEIEPFRHIAGRWLWKSPAETPFTAYVQAIALSPTDPHALLSWVSKRARSCTAMMAGRTGQHTARARCATAIRSFFMRGMGVMCMKRGEQGPESP